MPKIPLRLLSLAEMVIPGEPVADIGSDHALLPCYLVSQGLCPRAICSELRDGPFSRTLEAVNRNNLSSLIEVRQGDGLEVLAPGEVRTVVIAGMGGNNIIDILQRSTAKTKSFARLVLQPNNARFELRRLAASQGWRIENESVVRDGDFYVNLSIAPEPAEPYMLSEAELRWGPVLIKKKRDPAVREYFAFQLHKLARIWDGIPPAGSDRSRRRQETIGQRIKELEEVLS